jgi:hypothetical protein
VASIGGIRRPNINFRWLEAGRFLIQRSRTTTNCSPEAICVIGGLESDQGPVRENFDSRVMRAGPDFRARGRREERNPSIALRTSWKARLRPPQALAPRGEAATPTIDRALLSLHASSHDFEAVGAAVGCCSRTAWVALSRSGVVDLESGDERGRALRRSLAPSGRRYGRRPALAGMTGGRRWWTVSTISRVSIPWR